MPASETYATSGIELGRMRIYLDTNVFVVAIEHTGELRAIVQQLIGQGAKHPQLFVTSELTLAELLVKPLKLRHETEAEALDRRNAIYLTPGTLAAIYADLIGGQPGLQVWPVDRTILILSAFHRAGNSAIKLPDAIHLATAEQTECTHIVTGDQRLKPTADFAFHKIDLARKPLEALLESIQ